MLLISLPLAFQLGLSFFLFEQLQDAVKKFEQELHRIRIIASLDQVQHLHLQGLAAAAFYSVNKDEAIGEKHLVSLKQLAGELKHLKELTQDEPDLLTKTQELQKAVLAVVPYEMMMRRMSLMEGKLHLSEGAKARTLIKESMQLIEAYQTKLIPPVDDIDSFRRSAFELEIKLAAALVLILLGSMLFLYWSQKYVVSVIDVLTQQIEKFKNGESLQPVINTKDEIAELEKVLCESANRISSLESLRQELCSIVSHDIRAPMTSIGGLVTLLEVGALGELNQEHEELNNKLKVSSADLLNVLNNILDLDKLRSNKWPLEIHPTKNEEVCRRVQKEFENAEFNNVVTEVKPGVLNCDADAVARALLAIAQVFAEKTSPIKIECTESGGCQMILQGEATVSDIRMKSALSLAQLFCEKQSAKLSQSSSANTTVFSILPDNDSMSNRELVPTILEQVHEARSKTKRPYSKLGRSLLFLIGRPLLVSIYAIFLLSLLLTNTGHELGSELVKRKMVHCTSSLSSDMMHLMLLSIRRTSTEIPDEENARRKVVSKIDNDVQALRELEAKTHASMSDKLELIQNKVDRIKSFSKEMTSKPLDQLGSTLKKLVADGELSSVAFSQAGSLLTSDAELDSTEKVLLSKQTSDFLLVLVGASIATAFFTVFGAIEVSRGLIARLNNVGENAKRLTRREPLREPIHGGNDEIANLDTFFFESARKIAQLEVERKELSVLLREQLKAPLLFLRDGFSTILNEAKDLADKGKVLIQRTVVEIRRLSDLADDLLLLDTIEESGRISLDTEVTVTSIDEIVNRSIDAVTPQAKLKEIDIIYGGNASHKVRADASRSIQILVNLLSNAVKFSPEKETITVTTEPGDGTLRIVVTDRGRGIPEIEFHRIFSRFDQVSKDDNRKGSGLGLFISKKLAEAQNGTLDFASKEGEGSKFWLVLPMAGEV